MQLKVQRAPNLIFGAHGLQISDSYFNFSFFRSLKFESFIVSRTRKSFLTSTEGAGVEVCAWHVSSWMCFVEVTPKGSECCLALTASQSHSG